MMNISRVMMHHAARPLAKRRIISGFPMSRNLVLSKRGISSTNKRNVSSMEFAGLIGGGVLVGTGLFETSRMFGIDRKVGGVAHVGAMGMELLPGLAFAGWYVSKSSTKYAHLGKPLIGGIVAMGTLMLLQNVYSENKPPKESSFGKSMGNKLVYLVPIVVAPVAHILVSLGGAQGSFQKAKPFLLGAMFVTFGAISQRLYLMEDAGIDSGRHLWAQRE